MPINELEEFQALDQLLKRSNMSATILHEPVGDGMDAQRLFERGCSTLAFSQMIREELDALAAKVWEVSGKTMTIRPTRMSMGISTPPEDAGLKLVKKDTPETELPQPGPSLAPVSAEQVKQLTDDIYASEEFDNLTTQVARYGGTLEVLLHWRLGPEPLGPSQAHVNAAEALANSAAQHQVPRDVLMSIAALVGFALKLPDVYFCNMEVLDWSQNPQSIGTAWVQLQQNHW